jgi:CheY-like chemotaxis protein
MVISTKTMAKRILIADDSVTIQKAFAMTFAGADDVTLTSARSADEGLAIAQKVQPDLVIADGVMPGRSGYDLCAAIRADPGLRAVPVFILASSQQPYDESRGQKAGANGHLLKPWDTTAILDKLREALTGGVSMGAPAAPAGRPAASLPTAAMVEDDEYGEISIDERETDQQRARVPTPAPADVRARVATPPPPPPGRMASSPSIPIGVPGTMPPAPGSAAPTMRPSLIPGMRPGSIPPARPGTVPVRPTAASMPAAGPAPGAAPPRPAAPPVGRTMIGLPAANIPIPGVMRPTAPAAPAVAPAPAAAPMPPAAPARSPVTPMPPMTPVRSSVTPMPPVAPVRPPSAPVAPLAAHAPAAPMPPAAASAIIDQKMAAFAAKGPEYEVLAKLSREVIEQIVWEIVPELAEAIIRADLEKRGRL